MRIDDVRIHAFDGAGLRPVIVEIVTEDGVSGFGEAGVAYGLGATAAMALVRETAPHLLGRDAARIRAIGRDLYDHSFWTKGGGAISFAVLSAVDVALWDIAGRVAGRPLADLCGGRFGDRVPVYANGWNHVHDDVLAWARAAERPLRDGFRALKAYPFAHERPDGSFRHPGRRSLDPDLFARAIARVRELRRVVGPEITLMFDLSGGLARDQTARFLDVLADLDVAWIEEPTDPFDEAGLAVVARRSAVPIAVGERVYGRGGFRRVLETGAVDVIMPDVANCGGFSEALVIAAMAEAWNVRVAPHNCAGPVATAASLALCGAIAMPMTLELYPYFGDAPDWPRLLAEPIEARMRDGGLDVGDRPGLGVELDRRVLDRGLCWSAKRDGV